MGCAHMHRMTPTIEGCSPNRVYNIAEKNGENNQNI